MTGIEKFKQQLANVFDSDLRTKQWENYVDYTIIGLIIISTLSVFISTLNISIQCERVLHIIDIITVVAFTVEVSLRIWVADELDPKYKGFWGRLRYCCSFYGLIDILSTYTFYITFFLPLPYALCSPAVRKQPSTTPKCRPISTPYPLPLRHGTGTLSSPTQTGIP